MVVETVNRENKQKRAKDTHPIMTNIPANDDASRAARATSMMEGMCCVDDAPRRRSAQGVDAIAVTNSIS